MDLKHGNRFLSALAAFAGIVLIIGISGCDNNKTGQSQNIDLGGTYWYLTSFESGALELPVIPFTKITLFFKTDATGLYGNDSVNLYGSNYVLNGDEITLSDFVTTAMSPPLFPPGLDQQEELYLKLLEKSERVSSSENKLIIHCLGGELFYSRDTVYKYP